MIRSLVLHERAADGVTLLWLNRPERKNALDLAMRAALSESLIEIEKDKKVRVLVITGAGGDFCSGGDVSALSTEPMTAEDGRRRLQGVSEMVLRLHRLDKPVIAAVDGHAAGAGFSLALAADFLYASPNARFCASFGKLGLVPDAGLTYALPRRVGLMRAKELIFTARTLDAEEALSLGLATSIVRGRDVVDVAVEAAVQLSRGSPVAQSLAKRALDASLSSDLPVMLDREADAQGVCLASAYFVEAARRFLEKRPPRLVWRDPLAPSAQKGDAS